MLQDRFQKKELELYEIKILADETIQKLSKIHLNKIYFFTFFHY